MPTAGSILYGEALHVGNATALLALPDIVAQHEGGSCASVSVYPGNRYASATLLSLSAVFRESHPWQVRGECAGAQYEPGRHMAWPPADQCLGRQFEQGMGSAHKGAIARGVLRSAGHGRDRVGALIVLALHHAG